MSTVVSLTLDKTHRKARIAIPVDLLATLWDDTNKRRKSGAIKTSITGISSSGSLNTGESLTVSIAPANYNPACNTKVTQVTTGPTALSLGATYNHATVFNYGTPDPSARLNGDGTADLVYVDVELSIGATSSHVITVTYTALSLSAVDTYSALSSANAGAMAFALEPESDRAFGVVTLDAQGAANAYIAVQLSSVVSSVDPDDFDSADDPGPALNVQCAPNKSGHAYNLLDYQLPVSQGRTKSLANFYTILFALNGGKIDANSLSLLKPDATYGAQYCLLNVGVRKQSRAKVAATLNYLSKLVAL